MRSLPLLIVLLLAACGGDFDPAFRVIDLRVIGVEAEPPEIAPGEDSRLDALVVDPRSEAGDLVVAHFACTPGLDGANPCTSFEPLRDIGAIVRQAAVGRCPLQEGDEPVLGTAVPGGVALLGAQVCDPAGGCAPFLSEELAPVYRLPASLTLDDLPRGDPDRIGGREIAVITVAVHPLRPPAGEPCAALAALPGELAEVIENGAPNDAWVSAVKRLRWRGPDAVDEPNRNPDVPRAIIGGAPLEPGHAAAPEAKLKLRGETDSVPQRYLERGPGGEAGPERVERFTFSWFTTAGDLDPFHTRGTQRTEWTAPGKKGPARLWLLVRDLRGGVAWTSSEIEVGPSSAGP